MKIESIWIKTLFYITLFTFCIGLCCLNCIPDNDLWARLIAGGHIVETLSVLKNDFLSYTPTHTWYDHEWGASIFFYTALKYFGHEGLIYLKGILIAITMFICFKTVQLRKPQSTTCYNILYFVVMFLVAQRALGSITRCLLFTSLFFALFLYILEKSRQGKSKYLILLPIIMLFWSNIHGGCASGLGLIALYCVGEYLNKKQIKNYLLALAASLAVLFINPYGIEYVKFLFYAAAMDRSHITEWASPFHPYYAKEYLRYKFYLVFLLLVQVIHIIKNKINYEKLDKTKILIILAMAYLSITHLRHIPFFVLTAGTLLYDDFYSLLNNLTEKIKERFNIKNEDNIKSFVLAKNIVIYFVLLMVSVPPLLNQNKEVRITETKYPRYAIEFIKINKIEGNLFLSFDWGSYAAYKLYPNNLISMDGRYEEVYNPDLLIKIKDFHMVKNDWYKIIRDYKTDVIILEKHFPAYKKILEHPDWTLVFENNLSGVFVPTNKVKEKYLYPTPDDNYYNKTLFYTDIKFKTGT